MTFRAGGPPKSLTLDPGTGIITGTAPARGDYAAPLFYSSDMILALMSNRRVRKSLFKSGIPDHFRESTLYVMNSTLFSTLRAAGWLAAVGLVLVGNVPELGAAENWIQLFNGKNLDGWTPKIRGYEFGDNHAQTFQATNGAICIRYAGYKNFDDRFGHLFYRKPFTNFVLRVEYRFVGDQVPGGPGWAFRNSGVMIHCQDPASMRRDQEFPVCIEVQLLGGDGHNKRSTANLCTPGTHVVMDGKLHTAHCTDSTSLTYHGEQWVTAEVEAHGSGKIIHRVEGKNVLEYEKPQLDPGDPDGKALIKDARLLIEGGYISLQSESHPVEFRKVEIRELPE